MQSLRDQTGIQATKRSMIDELEEDPMTRRRLKPSARDFVNTSYRFSSTAADLDDMKLHPKHYNKYFMKNVYSHHKHQPRDALKLKQMEVEMYKYFNTYSKFE